ncbi:MAG: hypothetical protein K2W95_05840 [Candidatus Obscuribacterales bacterium]|nr:hypothetical protein [Candidatus Obscuribacterales bacterium]
MFETSEYNAQLDAPQLECGIDVSALLEERQTVVNQGLRSDSAVEEFGHLTIEGDSNYLAVAQPETSEEQAIDQSHALEQSAENQDGTMVTQLDNGASLRRERRGDGQPGRIVGATTANGLAMTFSYAGTSDQPISVVIGSQTYSLPAYDTIHLDQTTGGVKIEGRNPKDRSSWQLTQQLCGWREERSSEGTRTTTYDLGNRQETTVLVEPTTELVDRPRRVLSRRVTNEDGSWTQSDMVYGERLDNSRVTDILNSRHDPAGRPVPIPGLTRDQVNALRARDGLAPLAPQDEPTWQARIHTQQEQLDDQGARYVTFRGATEGYTYRAVIDRNSHRSETSSPLDKQKPI